MKVLTATEHVRANPRPKSADGDPALDVCYGFTRNFFVDGEYKSMEIRGRHAPLKAAR